jgi:putative molybdopterin biosynthesis protein
MRAKFVVWPMGAHYTSEANPGFEAARMTAQDVPELMTVSEVADYLRVKERTIYELVRTQRIPSCKLSGRLLFPKRLIELWVAQSSDFPQASVMLGAPPPVIAGSHDPLLEWAARESRCELAILVDGSTGGLHRLLAGQAVACGLHLIDLTTGLYDADNLTKSLPGLDFVVMEWARRQQGLVVAPGNPLGITSIRSLAAGNARFAVRQQGSGSASLLAKLLSDAGIALEDIRVLPQAATSETDIGISVREGRADAGLAIAAVAHEQRLDFVPLAWERFDLVVRVMEYFDPAFQKLLTFVRSPAFHERAQALTGYDVSRTGSIILNPRRRARES